MRLIAASLPLPLLGRGGAKIAVIEGPLTEAVPFTFRVKFPANFKVSPHWHPAVERVKPRQNIIYLRGE